MLLRHRLRHPRRADRQRAGRRGGPPVDRRRHARLHLAGRPDRRHRAAPHAAVHGVLRRRLPDPAARGGGLGKHLLEDLGARRRTARRRSTRRGAASGDPGPVSRAPGVRREQTVERCRRSAHGTGCSRPSRAGAPRAHWIGPDAPATRNRVRQLRRRGRRRRRGRACRRGAAAVRGEGRPARGAGRHRRVRRPVRPAAGPLPRAGARRVHGRRRHQGRHRPGHGQARHDRPRPGGHGRRRPGGVRRRAAVPAGLHRRRQARARADRDDRLRHRRGLPAGRLRAARRRDRRAPRPDGAGGYDLSATGVGDRRGRRRSCGPSGCAPATCCSAMGSVRPALQRLLAGPARAARHRPDAAGRPRRGVRPHPRRGAARSRPGSTRGTAWRWPPRPTCARSRTSPAAGWPATWRG